MESFTMFYIRDLLQPWKLVSLVLVIGVLIWGAEFFGIPDWDIPVSFLMAIPTYLTAGWVMREISGHRWKNFFACFIFIWFSVDGIYTIYWGLNDPEVLQVFRGVNAPISLAIYLAYGLVLMPVGSLKDLLSSISNPFTNSDVPLQ